jgi:SAM-dependent methyltransferase
MAQLQAKLDQNPKLPVKLDACSLTFPDDTSDYSFATFILVGLADDVGVASHILRTLKPGGTGVVATWKEMPWHVALENAHHMIRGADDPMAPFLSKSWYPKERVNQVTTAAGWKNVQFTEKEAWLNLGTDLKRWSTIAWTFLATPVGVWKQRDEDKWDEAIASIAEELGQSEWHRVEGGVHKIRMVANVASVRK